jgi:hypothetical protein
MNKGKSYWFFIFFLTFFIIIGTLNVQAENDNTPRTFVISDQYPYPGKFNSSVEDQSVGSFFSIYVYIVNNGGNFKPNDAAENVIVTLYKEDGTKLYSLTSNNIPEGEGYAEFSVFWPEDEQVFLKVSGTIFKNGSDHNTQFVSVQSNVFWIGRPNPTPQPGLGGLIWEKEIID